MDEDDRADQEPLDQIVEEETAPKPKAQHAPHPHGPEPSFLDKAWERQEKIERKWQSLGSGRFARVLRMARKPEPEEFRQSATIVLVGIGIIGGLGFSVYLLMNWLIKTVLHS
jgi:protein transport protein SEC61 subunit gamma-like protein